MTRSRAHELISNSSHEHETLACKSLLRLITFSTFRVATTTAVKSLTFLLVAVTPFHACVGEVCKNSIDRKLRRFPIIVVQDASQPLTAANDAFA
jgi:hypothetical protein